VSAEFLGLRIALVLAVGGAFVFSSAYTWWTRGACWRDSIGLTIQMETWFFALAMVPLLLAVFFHLSATSNAIGSWFLISGIGLAGVVLLWRTVVFGRERQLPGKDTERKDK
jgi:hypothetical protein